MEVLDRYHQHTSQLSCQLSGGGGGSTDALTVQQEALKNQTHDGSEENATCTTHLKKSLQTNVTS